MNLNVWRWSNFITAHTTRCVYRAQFAADTKINSSKLWQKDQPVHLVPTYHT